MKKHLRFLVLAATVLAILLCLVACNDNSSGKTTDATSKQNEEKTDAIKTEAPATDGDITAEPTEAPATDGDITAEPTEATEETVAAEGLWENATYLSDKEFGNGAKNIEVEVEVNGQSVTFTINTDADTLGAALLEHNLIAGENGQFGMYVKTVNGILADYDVNKSYWGFYQNGEYLMSGVDSTNISGGEHFEIVYSK